MMAAFLAGEDIAGIANSIGVYVEHFSFLISLGIPCLYHMSIWEDQILFWYRRNINEESLFFQVYCTMTCNSLF